MGNFLVCGESWVISKVQGAAVVGKLFLTREKSCSPFSAKYGTLFDLKQFSLSDELKCEEFISLSEKKGVTLLAVGALRRALTLHCISFVKMMTMIIMTMMMTMRKGRMVTMMMMMAGCPQWFRRQQWVRQWLTTSGRRARCHCAALINVHKMMMMMRFSQPAMQQSLQYLTSYCHRRWLRAMMLMMMMAHQKCFRIVEIWW